MKNIILISPFFLALITLFPYKPLYALPLSTDIIDTDGKIVGHLKIYIDYIEVFDATQTWVGKVGMMNSNGRPLLFLVRNNQARHIVGSAKQKQLHDTENNLIGYYDWSSFWSYAYDARGKSLGKSQCLAFRGLCSAIVSAYLNDLFLPTMLSE